MKILLPDGQQTILDDNLSMDEKLSLVEEIVEEWRPTIFKNWNSNSIKFFLDSLANYLVWHKEDRETGKRGQEDRFILSRKKMEKMVRFKKTSKTINFTDLSKYDSEKLFGERGME